MGRVTKECGVFVFVFVSVIILCAEFGRSARSEQEIRERFYGNLINSSAPGNGEGSIAKMFDRVLEKEFSENDQPESKIFPLYFPDFCMVFLNFDLFY